MMILWYMERYRDERRRQRVMTRALWKPWTGRMVAVMALLLAAVLLWVMAPPVLADENGNLYTVATDGGDLNVRENPWEGSEIVGWLQPGDAVRVMDTSDGWASVAAPDGPLPVEPGGGWVRADYLTQDPGGETICQNSSGGRARVRDKPGGALVRWLEKGDSVTVSRWTTVDGVTWGYVGDGYVREDCLTEVDADE